MKPIVYLLLQMRLEGIEQAGDDLITPIAAGCLDFPLVLSARTADGERLTAWDIRLPPDLREQLGRQHMESFRSESALELLRQTGIEAESSQYRTYVFPDSYASAEVLEVRTYPEGDQKVIQFGFGRTGPKVFAVERGDLIVAACASSRQDSACAEAWVFTAPEHRRRGLAQKVVTAWAASLLNEGLVPLYSHRLDNTASEGLARKLNLVPAFDELVITRVATSGKTR